MPSVLATLAQGDAPSDFMAFALAAALRFLVPMGEQPRSAEHPPVFTGRCCPLSPPPPASTPPAKRKRGETEAARDSSAAQASPTAAGLAEAARAAEARAAEAARAGGASYEYTAGLSASPTLGTYEFRDGDGFVPLVLRPLGTPSGCTAAGASHAPTRGPSPPTPCTPHAHRMHGPCALPAPSLRPLCSLSALVPSAHALHPLLAPAAASLAGEVLARLPGFDVHGKHGEKLRRLACRAGALLHQAARSAPCPCPCPCLAHAPCPM
jgi:hypothetical protein